MGCEAATLWHRVSYDTSAWAALTRKECVRIGAPSSRRALRTDGQTRFALPTCAPMRLSHRPPHPDSRVDHAQALCRCRPCRDRKSAQPPSGRVLSSPPLPECGCNTEWPLQHGRTDHYQETPCCD